MQFFDSHCHFDFTDFDDDRDSIWRDCNALGISNLIIPGVSPESWPIATAIAKQYKNIYVACGLHPWWIKKNIDANDLDKYLATIRNELQEYISQQKYIAIGECGLDAAIETSLALQQQVLSIHLKLSQLTGLPLILHCRKAHNELIQQLKAYELAGGGVIHGFSGSYELAATYWDMGFRLGIGGTITYERANKTRDAVKKLPLEAILLETDAPDMPMSGKQGERNSPTHIIQIAQVLADLRSEPLENIAQQTTLNSKTLFKILS